MHKICVCFFLFDKKKRRWIVQHPPIYVRLPINYVLLGLPNIPYKNAAITYLPVPCNYITCSSLSWFFFCKSFINVLEEAEHLFMDRFYLISCNIVETSNQGLTYSNKGLQERQLSNVHIRRIGHSYTARFQIIFIYDSQPASVPLQSTHDSHIETLTNCQVNRQW